MTLFFDLETQFSADEVGGWQNRHLMRLALAVIYDLQKKEYGVYKEDQVFDLIERLKSSDLIVGFNIKEFDFEVLSIYSDFDFSSLSVVDIFEDVYKGIGFRLGLDHLARATLGEGKLASGLASTRWFRDGQVDRVEEYCRRDVDLIRRLYEYGSTHGYLIYQDQAGVLQRIWVDW